MERRQDNLFKSGNKCNVVSSPIIKHASPSLISRLLCAVAAVASATTLRQSDRAAARGGPNRRTWLDGTDGSHGMPVWSQPPAASCACDA